MMLVLAGTPLVLVVVLVTLVALVAFAIALWRRSWPVWLLGYSLLVGALVTAWSVRGVRVNAVVTASGT